MKDRIEYSRTVLKGGNQTSWMIAILENQIAIMEHLTKETPMLPEQVNEPAKWNLNHDGSISIA